jgi:hypothetical protein
MKDIKDIIKEIDKEINSPEAKRKVLEREEQCNIIKQMPLNTKEDIQRAKEASRSIPQSAEKVLLFKYLNNRTVNIE